MLHQELSVLSSFMWKEKSANISGSQILIGLEVDFDKDINSGLTSVFELFGSQGCISDLAGPNFNSGLTSGTSS